MFRGMDEETLYWIDRIDAFDELQQKDPFILNPP